MLRLSRFAISMAVLALVITPAWAAGNDNRAPIYDEKADAQDLLDAALKRAKAEEKRVLIQWGGNWCGWCWKLHDLFESNTDIKKVLADEYVLVLIDTEAGEALMKKLNTKPEGVPYLTFLDADGDKLADQDTGSLEEGDHHVPARMLAVLEKWTTPAKDAKAVFNDATRAAAAEQKMVFVRFSTPSCGWCKRLDVFLETDLAARTLAPHFVYAKIDQAEMLHGRELREQLAGGRSGGVPWFAFTDAQGKTLITSDGPDGNVGFPVKPNEIEHFMAMLKTTCPDLDQASLDELAAHLRIGWQ